MISKKRAASLVRYDPETGKFFWLVKRGGKHPGDEAGSICGNGRRYIRLDGQLYLASRLAFLLMLGRWPRVEADHENMNPEDDRWCNLREATRSQNNQNTSVRHNNASGFKGVSFQHGRFVAEVWANRTKHYVGRFDTAAEAATACAAARIRLHGEFARN